MNDKKIKSMLKKKENKKKLRELWYKIIKPLAFVSTKLDDKIYLYVENKIKKKVDSLTLDEVAKKASNLIIADLVNNSCGYEIYITIADSCNRDYCETILDYIHSSSYCKNRALYNRWINKNSRFGHNLQLNKKLTTIVENNLKNNSMIWMKHEFIERLKYSYASENYKETVIFGLVEDVND